MNLENFKVAELSQEENTATNGGLLLTGWGGLAYYAGYALHGVVNFFSYQPVGNGGGML